MNHISIHDLRGDERKRWATARKAAYRKVLRDRGATEQQRMEARAKLNAIERGSR
jgi:hypothetical protein